MAPTAGRRTAHDRPRRTARGNPRALLGALTAICALTLGLTSCGGTAQAGDAPRPSDVAAWTGAQAGAQAVERQADVQRAAVTAAVRTAAAAAAERAAAGQAGGAGTAARQGGPVTAGPGGEAAAQCTTRPEDRAACTMPEGARITPGGGDVDGDGVFEQDEPVGPGATDPRAYDGGRTSGESQCAWARQQGYGC